MKQGIQTEDKAISDSNKEASSIALDVLVPLMDARFHECEYYGRENAAELLRIWNHNKRKNKLSEAVLRSLCKYIITDGGEDHRAPGVVVEDAYKTMRMCLRRIDSLFEFLLKLRDSLREQGAEDTANQIDEALFAFAKPLNEDKHGQEQ